MKAAELLEAVIDASVGIKLFVQEDGSALTDLLFSHLADDPPASFFAPDLFCIECTNILWKYVRNYGYAEEVARQNVMDLQRLALHRISTVDLIADAFELALALDVTVYDACYAALAKRLELPLVTADEVLTQKLSQSDVVCILLRNLK